MRPEMEKLKKLLARRYKWEAHPYQPADDQAMLRMWQQEHQDDDRWTQEYFTWEYQKNPAGKALIQLAKSQGELIGQYVLMPLRFRLRGKEMLGSIALNTLTRSDHRGQGVHVLLAEEAFDECARLGIAFSYGSPNEKAYRGTVTKMAFADIGKMVLMVKVQGIKQLLPAVFRRQPLKLVLNLFSPLISLLLKVVFFARPVKPCPGLNIRSTAEIDRRFDDLWARAQGQFINAGIRDAEYLRWRYLDKPGEPYKILVAEEPGRLAGYVVLAQSERLNGVMGIIVDMLLAEGEGQKAVAGKLLEAAEKMFRQMNKEIVACLVTPNSSLEKYLALAGFRRCPDRFKSGPFPIIIRNHGGLLDAAQTHDLNDWYLTFGDFDIY